MYRIVSEGKIVSLCENLRYVKRKQSTRAYIQCNEEEAEAIAVRGTLYNIQGKTDTPDIPIAEITVVDNGEFVFNNYVDRYNFDDKITAIEDAMCEMDALEE